MQRVIPHLGAAVLLLAVTACASSSASSTSSNPGVPPSYQDLPAASLSQTPASPAASGQFPLAGTITETADATTFEVGYQIGPIQYTPPPAAVLDACNDSDPAITSQMAFTPGELTIAYTQGSLVQEVEIDTSSLIIGGNWEGDVAVFLGGQWQCQQDYGPLDLNVPPHSVGQYPIWIMSLVLSNAQPQVSSAEADSWEFSWAGVFPVGYIPAITTSGPNAASCDGSDVLMVYADRPSAAVDPDTGANDCGPV